MHMHASACRCGIRTRAVASPAIVCRLETENLERIRMGNRLHVRHFSSPMHSSARLLRARRMTSRAGLDPQHSPSPPTSGHFSRSALSKVAPVTMPTVAPERSSHVVNSGVAVAPFAAKAGVEMSVASTAVTTSDNMQTRCPCLFCNLDLPLECALSTLPVSREPYGVFGQSRFISADA